jgi:formate dehydrogenase subunit gamma
MSYPLGTIIRNTTAARINHWITAACFVLLMLSGLSMFHPLLFFLSALFGSGQWARAIHPWIGCVLLVSYTGLIVQFWRDNFWNRDDVAWMVAIVRVLRNEEEGVPEVGRFNAGQKFVFWSMALLVPALFLTGLVIWEAYFGEATTIEQQRAAALIHSYAAIAAIIIWITHVYAAIWVRGSMRGMTQGHVDPRLGVASSSQMAAQPRGDTLARAASAACGRGFMRQGETAPKGGWIGNASGGVKAPEPIPLPNAAVRFARTAERLERLSRGHPMEAWLNFMAKVTRAQHHAGTKSASKRSAPSPTGARRVAVLPGGSPRWAEGGAWREQQRRAPLRSIGLLPTAAVTCGSRLRRRKNGVQTSTIELRARVRGGGPARQLQEGGRGAQHHRQRSEPRRAESGGLARRCIVSARRRQAWIDRARRGLCGRGG